MAILVRARGDLPTGSGLVITPVDDGCIPHQLYRQGGREGEDGITALMMHH